jgi:lipopolysaccharide transport system permease protein
MNRPQKRNQNDIQEVVYTPYAHLGLGWRVWREMGQQLICSRGLTWRLFLRELSARYRQSVFGYVWAVMPAIVTVIAFTYLNRSRILPIGKTDIPYPAFVLLGITVWQVFSTGLTASTQSIVNAGYLITKANFARESLVLAAFGQSILDFLIRLVLVAMVFAWLQVVPAWTVVVVPFVLIPLALMTLGFGFVLALANGVFRDIGNALTLVLTVAMFLTPVVYPPPTAWPKVLINYVNPISPFIIATRDLTTEGTLSHPHGLLLASVVSLVIFLVGWRIFHVAMARIAERV